MEITIYNKWGKRYKITNIEYTTSNGRDTYIEYQTNDELYDDKLYNLCFEGWLDLGQIIERLSQIIDED